MASTMVTVFPVPGGPKTRNGAGREDPARMCLIADNCCVLWPIFRSYSLTRKQNMTSMFTNLLHKRLYKAELTEGWSLRLVQPDLFSEWTVRLTNTSNRCVFSKWRNSNWIEQGLTSHQTHYRSCWKRVFTGQMTQPTVSKHWRKIGPKD